MGWYPSNQQKGMYLRLPKVDLHRHLEGSMRIETLMEVVKIYGITLPLRPDLRSLVQMRHSDPLTFSTFLSKFQILRLFYRSPEIIGRLTREAVEDAAADGVLYMDLHFTPVALARYQGFSLADVMDWVADSAKKSSQEHQIEVRLIASVNRHESVELAEQVVRLAVDRIDKGIVALDLAGNEAEYPATPFAGLFREARAAGLAIAVHAGEWGKADNVRQALEDLQADRVVHGVRILEEPYILAMACEKGTPFEVCVTSNHQTGVVASLSQHPVMRMLQSGLNVTINTDDPSISQITLTDEYQLACEQLGMPRSVLADRILAGAQAAFLSADERAVLIQRLNSGLAPLYR